MDVVQQTLKQHGPGGFFKGIVPCLLRAGPVNAGSFLIYENSLRYFTKKN